MHDSRQSAEGIARAPLAPVPAAVRHGLYYAPRPSSLLARLGSRWLGRDATTGAALPQPEIAGLAPGALTALTASARRYGLHATLKAPIALAEGHTAEGLAAALDAFALTRARVTIPALKLQRIGRFLALVPDGPVPPLDDLAAAVVTRFDPFRRPAPPQELARRRQGGLSPREEALLLAWGYPYVLDTFRFHITLSDGLEEPVAGLVEAAARRHFAPALGHPVVVDAIAHFIEPAAGEPFRLARFVALGGLPVRQHP